MICYTNCHYEPNDINSLMPAVTSAGMSDAIDFEVVKASFKDIVQVLKEVKKETNILGLDVETYAHSDIVKTRSYYHSLRISDYRKEGKKYDLQSVRNKFNKEYDAVLKDVALNPRINTIRLIQINTGTEILIVDLINIKDPTPLFKEIMKFSLIGQNIKFDVKSIKGKKEFSWFEPKELYDIMVGNKYFRVTKIAGKFRNNLAEVIKYWLDIEIEKSHGASYWGGIITDSMFAYSYYDVFYLFDVMNKQIKNINAGSINLTKSKPYFNGMLKDRVAIIEMKFLYPLLETELKGIPVNIPYLKEQRKVLEKQVNKLKKPFISINYRSPQQLQEFLFDKSIFVPSTGKPVLMRYKDHKIIRDLLELKKYTKRLQMVTDYIDEHAESNDRIYVNFNGFTGNAGRMSATNPNSQQIPHVLKEDFYLPQRGFKMCKADYPSLEARIVGVYTRDTKIISIFSEPKSTPVFYRDMHYITSGAFYGKDPKEVTKEERHVGKPANFGLMFGMGIQSYIDYCYENFEMEIDEQESRRQHKIYFNLYPGIKRFHNSNGNMLRQNNIIICKTLLGRRVMTDMYTNAANYPIQGSAADIFKLACVLFYGRIKKEKLEAWIVNFIHDEVIVEAKSQHMKQVKVILKKSMEDSINFVLTDFTTEVKIDDIK